MEIYQIHYICLMTFHWQKGLIDLQALPSWQYHLNQHDSNVLNLLIALFQNAYF